MKIAQLPFLLGLLVLVGCSSNIESAASDANASLDVICACDGFARTDICIDGDPVSDAAVECIETVLEDFPEVTYECEATNASRLLDCVDGADCNPGTIQSCFRALPSCDDGRSDVLEDRLEYCENL